MFLRKFVLYILIPLFLIARKKLELTHNKQEKQKFVEWNKQWPGAILKLYLNYLVKSPQIAFIKNFRCIDQIFVWLSMVKKMKLAIETSNIFHLIKLNMPSHWEGARGEGGFNVCVKWLNGGKNVPVKELHLQYLLPKADVKM